MIGKKVSQILCRIYVQLVISPVERAETALFPLKRWAKNCIIYHKRRDKNRMNTGFSVAEIV